MRKYILLIILFVLFTFPIWLYIIWQFKYKKELKLTIIDKTVLDNKFREHSSLTWILKNRKYCCIDRQLYNPATDYYGFFPMENYKYHTRDLSGFDDKSMNKLVKNSDLTYVTDTYGIYYQEWYKENPRGEHSPLIYGGMNKSDLTFLKFMKRQRKLIISEFNCIASPTGGSIRNEFENMFGIRWTGWVGRYFYSLDTLVNEEIPLWLVRDYKLQHNNKWNFKNAGVAFVHESGRIEILENNIHLSYKMPVIITKKGNQKRFGIPPKVNYDYWFDVILTSHNNNVISVYKINSNSKGDSILASMNIPNPFPAVIEHYDQEYKFYYFCGDFCDNPLIDFLSNLHGITYFKKYLPLSLVLSDREAFFWTYYEPLVSNILDTYHNSVRN